MRVSHPAGSRAFPPPFRRARCCRQLVAQTCIRSSIKLSFCRTIGLLEGWLSQLGRPRRPPGILVFDLGFECLFDITVRDLCLVPKGRFEIDIRQAGNTFLVCRQCVSGEAHRLRIVVAAPETTRSFHKHELTVESQEAEVSQHAFRTLLSGHAGGEASPVQAFDWDDPERYR